MARRDPHGTEHGPPHPKKLQGSQGGTSKGWWGHPAAAAGKSCCSSCCGPVPGPAPVCQGRSLGAGFFPSLLPAGPHSGVPAALSGCQGTGTGDTGGLGKPAPPLGSVPGGLRTCPAHHTVASPPSFLARSWESAARHGKLQQRWGRINPPTPQKSPPQGPIGTRAPARPHPAGTPGDPALSPAPQVALVTVSQPHKWPCHPGGGVPGDPQQGQALGSPGQDPAGWC